MRYRVGLVLATLVGAAPSHAHVGAVVANATFKSPALATTRPVDGGLALEPYAIAQADASFTISWEDGDIDPTGRFYFYYLDHQPSFGVQPDDVRNLAAPMVEVGESTGPVAIWSGCTCAGDAGVVCPDAGVRDCRNAFSWDTSQIPTGTYWPIAVNDDYPYLIYSTGGPVRIAHGTDPLPPAVIVLRPDGYGSFDTSYIVEWYAIGTPPLTIDLAYGLNDAGKALGPTTSLIKNVQAPIGPDGTQSYEWDITQLHSGSTYFLRVTVTDGNGTVSYSDSRYALSVFHPQPDDGSVIVPINDGAANTAHDLGVIKITPHGGCGCSITGTHAPEVGSLALLVGMGLLLLRRARAR